MIADITESTLKEKFEYSMLTKIKVKINQKKHDIYSMFHIVT